MEMKSFTKCFFVLFGILVIGSMLATLYPADETLRVGTFDSRAIAVAYGNSEMFRQKLSSMREKYNKAKEEGDEKLIKEFEAFGPASQQVMHQQAFSIACVAEIVETVEAELPKVAQEAGVDIIVSKWEVIYKNPSIQIVDVTSQLVKLFNPSERGLKSIESLLKQKPMPLVDLLIAEKHEM